MKSQLFSILKKSILFPSSPFNEGCLLCGHPTQLLLSHSPCSLCESCFSLSWSPDQTPLLSQSPLLLNTLFHSHSPLYALMLKAKMNGNKPLFHLLIRGTPLLFSSLSQWTHPSKSPLYFVPLCARQATLQLRKFNPAYQFALELEKVNRNSVIHPTGLKRCRTSQIQRTLKRSQRLSAQHQTLYACSSLKNQRVCLVDDITTTGATLLEAQRACLEVGVRECYALALFRG